MRRGSIVAAGFAAAALVLVVAACGGGGSASPTTTPTHTIGPTGVGPTGVGPTGVGPTGSGGFASSQNCRDFALIGAKIASAIGSTTGSGGNAAEAAKAQLQAWADAAPDDVKADFQTIATAFGNFLDAVQGSGYTFGSTTPPTAAQLAALTQAARAFATPQVKAASKHLQAWTATNCTAMH